MSKRFSVSDPSPHTEYIVTLTSGRKITAYTSGMLAEVLDDPGFLVGLDEVAECARWGKSRDVPCVHL